MEPFVAQIILFGGNFAPRGWAFCHGQLLSISQHQALFSLLGTIYGGDGRTTFALPDLRGRVPIGFGSGPGLSTRRQGEQVGSEINNLSINQLPVHNHIVNLNVKEEGDTDDPNGSFIAGDGTNAFGASSDTDKKLANSTSNNTGSGQAVNNMQPSLGLNYIIALMGTYPSRS